MSERLITHEVETLTRSLLGVCGPGGYPLPIMAIVTAVLNELGISASTQRCLCMLQKDCWQSDFNVDAMQINGQVCRFNPTTISYGWETLIADELFEMGGAHCYEILRFFDHNLETVLAEHKNMADPTYLEDFLDEARSKAQHWQISRHTPDELPRSRRTGL